MAKTNKKTSKKREDIEIDLTVCVHFGADYEPVTLVENRRVPFVKAMFMLRRHAGELIYTTILKAAVMQPKVMRKLLPVASAIPSKAMGLMSTFSGSKK